MQIIPVDNLSVGQRLAEAVYLTWGQKFLEAGTELRHWHIQWLQQWAQGQVILAAGPEELVRAGIFKPLNLADLQLGRRAGGLILTGSGRVLLEAGQEIESHHQRALAVASSVFVSPVDGYQRQAMVDWARRLAAELQEQLRDVVLRVQPVREAGSWQEVSAGRDRPSLQQLAALRRQGLEHLAERWACIEAGQTVAVEDFRLLIEPLLQILENYPSWVAHLAMAQQGEQDDLLGQSYSRAVLAAAAAARLGWPKSHIRELTLAGLLADLSMLFLPACLRNAEKRLNAQEHQAFSEHPYLSLLMLEALPEASPLVRLAVLQHQEREAGQGYPQRLSGPAISDYARVLAAADVLAAAIGRSPSRRMVLPYLAMEQLVGEAARRLLWRPAVQALIQACGRFPVGSWVKLSDGRQAFILSCHFQKPDRPLVEILDETAHPTGRLIDLADPIHEKLAIVRALAGPCGEWVNRTEAA